MLCFLEHKRNPSEVNGFDKIEFMKRQKYLYEILECWFFVIFFLNLIVTWRFSSQLFLTV